METNKKNELTISFEKLGIKGMTDRIESAEDVNIRFSRFDSCFVSGIEYDDGRISENTRYTRLSDTFERAYQVLKDWYDIDYHYYRKDKDSLSCDYGFISKFDLSSITIDIYKFHNHLYKIKVGYGYDSKWYDIDNLEKDLGRILQEQLEKSNNINVKVNIREIKLKSLLC